MIGFAEDAAIHVGHLLDSTEVLGQAARPQKPASSCILPAVHSAIAMRRVTDKLVWMGSSYHDYKTTQIVDLRIT